MFRLIQLSIILLVAAPLYAVGTGPLINDPGTGGGGAGSYCVASTCSRTCPDGSMSGIACLSRENAKCACDGLTKGYFSQAAPYCTACTPYSP